MALQGGLSRVALLELVCHGRHDLRFKKDLSFRACSLCFLFEVQTVRFSIVPAISNSSEKLDHSVDRKKDLLGIKLPRPLRWGDQQREKPKAEKQANFI